MLNDAELEALAVDIRTSGSSHICDDLLLDGRDRAPACERTGAPVAWETVPAVGARHPSPVVTSSNLQRRHLDESRRALAAAKLANRGARARAASSVK